MGCHEYDVKRTICDDLLAMGFEEVENSMIMSMSLSWAAE